MKKIAKFEKVSLEQFKKDWSLSDEAEQVFESIVLPKRATRGSAGYDFFSPVAFELKPGETIKMPTGIRARIDEGWVLKCYPRSGLGFKFRLQLDNTVGIIDSDYYDAANEGHIMAKLTNCSLENKTLCVKQGEAVFQGVFVEYGITYDDEVEDIRVGGFGSTSK